VGTSIPQFSAAIFGARSSWCSILSRSALIAAFLVCAVQLPAREKNGVQYGVGLIVNLPFPEGDVLQVVQEVAQNGIIRGSKEYNKDEYISGASPAPLTRVFPTWTDEGKVFYKVRAHAVDPRHFRDSGDVGTLAVRYVVQAQGDKNCVLHIDAVFVEDFRHTTHLSDGSVESAEYKDIHDRLDAIASMKALDAEAEREKREHASSSTSQLATLPASPVAAMSADHPATTASPGAPDTHAPEAATTPSQTLEERVKDLQRQVERRVKAPGAALKAAPFHSAATLQSLPAGSEVLVVITSPYWLGVETHDGQHGWMLRDDLEVLP